MSTNDDITRRDFAKMTATVTVVAGGTLGAGSRAAKAAAPALAMTASGAIGAIARGDLSAEEYAGALLARADELKDLNACILLNRDGFAPMAPECQSFQDNVVAQRPSIKKGDFLHQFTARNARSS